MTRDSRHEHKVEELNQLLQLVETASAKRILVIGTTNRVEAIDPAFLRRGRVDLQMEVEVPTVEEITGALAAIFEVRPLTIGADLAGCAARLVGRPMSDLEWFANEASRLTAQGGKISIDDLDLTMAMRALR